MNNKVCCFPFTDLNVFRYNFYTPCCPNWLDEQYWYYAKYNDSAYDIWFNEKFQKLRTDWLTNRQELCKLCPSYNNNVISSENPLRQYPETIAWGNLQACNLKCYTCRKEFLRNEIIHPTHQRIIDAFYPHAKRIILCHFGEPFFSEWYLNMLKNLDYPHLKIELFTNALLMPSKWDSLKKIHNQINSLVISIDAATKETYEKVRYPGKWEDLQKALQFINNNVKFNYLQLNFVVRKINYKEMPLFVEMCEQFNNVDRICFQLFSPTWHTPDEYNKELPYHLNDYKLILNEVMQHPKVHVDQLLGYQTREITKIPNEQILKEINNGC